MTGWHSFTTLPAPDPSAVRQPDRNGKEWTTHEERELLSLRADGADDAEIADRLRRTVASVRNRVYRQHLPLKDGWKRWSSSEEQRLSALWEVGATPRKISKHIRGRSPSSIARKAVRMGLVPQNHP